MEGHHEQKIRGPLRCYSDKPYEYFLSAFFLFKEAIYSIRALHE